MKKISHLWRMAKNTLISLTVIALAVGSVQAAPFGDVIKFWDDRENGSAATIDHAPWQELLDKYLNDQVPDGINRFDYSGVTEADTNRLEAYLQDLQRIEPRQLNSNEQKAYWINLYNAQTIFIILDNDPDLSSIRQIRSGVFKRGPWQLKGLTVVTQELSLDDIEHGILRPIWRDNRIHYAVNCASLGCPNLMKTAFTGENIESLLEQAASDYINHPRGVNVEGGELILSSIFDWYAEDFGSSFGELIDHLLIYADEDLTAALPAYNGATYVYDWAINRP